MPKKCKDGYRWCPIKNKCIPAGQGNTQKEQDDEIDISTARPYDHPKKKSIIKEPPTTDGGPIKMTKIKEKLSSFNEDYKILENMVKQFVEEMCGKKHVEEEENEIDHVPSDEPAEQLADVQKDIGETKSFAANALIELILGENEYREYFKKMLAKHGVTSPAQLSPEKRKAFFSAVEKGWTKEKE